MPYSFAILDEKVGEIQGRRYRAFTLREDDVSGDDAQAWTISGLPPWFVVTHFQCVIEDADEATTVQPQLGSKAGFTVGSLDEVGLVTEALAVVNIACPLRVSSPDGLLVGRSKPDAHANAILTRVTIVEGHL